MENKLTPIHVYAQIEREKERESNHFVLVTQTQVL